MSIIKNNQSTLDISTQTYGDVRSVVDFCIENNLSITEDVPAGTPFNEIPETEYINEVNQAFFFNKQIELTTSEPKTLPDAIGIGVMIIESDFDVT